MKKTLAEIHEDLEEITAKYPDFPKIEQMVNKAISEIGFPGWCPIDTNFNLAMSCFVSYKRFERLNLPDWKKEFEHAVRQVVADVYNDYLIETLAGIV